MDWTAHLKACSMSSGSGELVFTESLVAMAFSQAPISPLPASLGRKPQNSGMAISNLSAKG